MTSVAAEAPGPERLVTGEAVEVDLRVARLPSRTVALLIDLAIVYVVLSTLLSFVIQTQYAIDVAWTIGLLILTTVLVIIGYPATCETLTRGRTLGKLAMGLRVVAEDGSPIRFRQALVRALAGFVEIYMFYGAPALLCSLIHPRGKRLGDTFAGTIVIQERVPAGAGMGAVAIMPPQLASWAVNLEISRLPDDLALATRQYLARFWELAPAVRDEMGQRIFTQVMSYVSPPPPAGMRPEIYLSAVLAERRTREERRLADRAARRAAILQRSHLPGLAPPIPAYAAGPYYPAAPQPAMANAYATTHPHGAAQPYATTHPHGAGPAYATTPPQGAGQSYAPPPQHGAGPAYATPPAPPGYPASQPAGPHPPSHAPGQPSAPHPPSYAPGRPSATPPP